MVEFQCGDVVKGTWGVQRDGGIQMSVSGFWVVINYSQILIITFPTEKYEKMNLKTFDEFIFFSFMRLFIYIFCDRRFVESQPIGITY